MDDLTWLKSQSGLWPWLADLWDLRRVRLNLCIKPARGLLVAATREQLWLAFIVWIEKTYHRRRRQDARGRFTPTEFEMLDQAAHAA